MDFLIPLMAVLGAFGLPMYIAKLRHEEKKKRLEIEAKSRGGGADDGEVKRITDENRLLRERVENLETIVCSVDFELNQKLAKVIDDQRSVLQLPAGAPAGKALAAKSPEEPLEEARAAEAPAGDKPAPLALDRTATSHAPAPLPLTSAL
jgi:hypothetical protein